jgi:hypothetical protein
MNTTKLSKVHLLLTILFLLALFLPALLPNF